MKIETDLFNYIILYEDIHSKQEVKQEIKQELLTNFGLSFAVISTSLSFLSPSEMPSLSFLRFFVNL